MCIYFIMIDPYGNQISSLDGYRKPLCEVMIEYSFHQLLHPPSAFNKRFVCGPISSMEWVAFVSNCTTYKKSTLHNILYSVHYFVTSHINNVFHVIYL